MRLNPIPLFKDPKSRPRMIVWCGVLLIALVIVWATAIVGTSFAWFCEEPCHVAHYDNTLAYNKSTHTRVSCIACHEPVAASPLQMTLLKIEVAPDLFKTISGDFELPLNAASHYAVEIGSDRCTQCHNLANRPVTPSAGLKIDHDVHSEKDVTCTTCHNRVAHPEDDIELTLSEEKHQDWMTMDACFRCHSLAKESDAPGTCTACHTPDFKLTPPSHDASSWYTLYGESKGHAEAAKEESASIAEAAKRNAEHGELDPEEAVGPVLKPSNEINSCYTCHAPSYCNSCHVVAMPHPAEFKKNHGEVGYKDPAVCAKCHARNSAEAKGDAVCNACHHPASKPGTPWQRQHPSSVIKDGAQACYECHDPTYCETCHVSGPEAAESFLEESADD